MAGTDRERQVAYTKFRLAELIAQRDGLDALIEYEEKVLATLKELDE